MASDAVLDDMRKVCDDRARAAGESDRVAGVPARYVVAPTSTQEAAEVLRLAGRHDLRVVARGGETKLAWGAAPKAVDLIVDTSLMDGLVEHAAGDLVVVVRAGTSVETLQSKLAEAGQQLSLDTSHRGATVGGTVAVNASGPRRLLYGTVRDLLIGVTFVRADGVVAKSGGKVVKNVAGYDFGKLLTGSYGTLGLITQATFRLHPLPKATRVLTVEVPDPDVAGRSMAAITGSQVVASAVEVDQPSDGRTSVAVLLEGTEHGVAGRAATAGELLGGAAAVQEAPGWFGTYPFEADGIGLKLTTEISGVTRLLTAVRHTARRHDVPVHVRGSASGVLYAGLPGGTDPRQVVAVVEDLRAAATTGAGSVVVLTAPAQVREALDMWGPVRGLDLMRRLKDELDPEHRLSPGRYVGGI